jgi:hypothetical protein
MIAWLNQIELAPASAKRLSLSYQIMSAAEFVVAAAKSSQVLFDAGQKFFGDFFNIKYGLALRNRNNSSASS